MAQRDIPRYPNPSLQVIFVYIGYVWRNRSLLHLHCPYGTGLGCKTTSIHRVRHTSAKLWNVGRWTCGRIWDEIDHIPNHNELSYSKPTNAMMTCIRSRSQRSFKNSLRRSTAGTANDANGDTRAKPARLPQTRHEHPRPTVTFKAAGFKLDTQYNRVRLSKAIESEGNTGRISSCGTKLPPTLTSLPWRMSNRFGQSDGRQMGTPLRL